MKLRVRILGWRPRLQFINGLQHDGGWSWTAQSSNAETVHSLLGLVLIDDPNLAQHELLLVAGPFIILFATKDFA